MGAINDEPEGQARHDSHEGATTVVSCSFCRGTGTDPFGVMSWISSCCVCGGKGKLRIPVPYRSCPHCQKTGAVKTFTCGVCRGTGYLAMPAGPTVACPECRGTGDAAGAPALACLRCGGHGLVPAGSSGVRS